MGKETWQSGGKANLFYFSRELSISLSLSLSLYLSILEGANVSFSPSGSATGHHLPRPSEWIIAPPLSCALLQVEKTEEFRVDDLITRQVCYHSCWYVGLLLPELGLTMAFLRTGLRAKAIYTALRNNVACMSSVPQPIVNPEIKYNKVGQTTYNSESPLFKWHGKMEFFVLIIDSDCP